MCCVGKYIRRRNQARVKNADLRHPSCTVVMQRRKCVSPVLSVLSYVVAQCTDHDITFISKEYQSELVLCVQDRYK